MIIVMPSSKAAELEVFYKPVDAKQGKKLDDGQELACTAGQMLTGLSKENHSCQSMTVESNNFYTITISLLISDLLKILYPVFQQIRSKTKISGTLCVHFSAT